MSSLWSRSCELEHHLFSAQPGDGGRVTEGGRVEGRGYDRGEEKEEG